MKIPPRNLPIVFVILALVVTTPHFAIAKSSGSGNGGKKAAPVVPHHTTIQTISATSITIKSSGTKTLTITQDTVITFKRQTVKFDALKPGMRVSFVAASDPTIAARIDADDPPAEAKK